VSRSCFPTALTRDNLVRAIRGKTVWLLLLALILVRGGAACAQADVAIPESALREPWVRELAVLESLSATITSTPAGEDRVRLDDALTYLQVTLGEFEVQVDRVIDRIAADAQFPFAASETSEALGAQLSEIHARFDTLYAALGVQQREDVRAAQASLDALRQLLQDKVPFDRDVERAFGSGLRQQRVALATRWWNGEERAIAVKKLVAELRQKVSAAFLLYKISAA
jgi:hypothetical protein